MLEFEWNDAKREEVWQTRRIDFETVAQVFLGKLVTVTDEREDYRETRYRSIGEVDGEC